jgi:hypothetical protein
MLTYRGFDVTQKEKLDKIARDFSLLPEEKQDYILGVLQALVFARETNGETVISDSEQNFESVYRIGNPPALPGI